MANKLDNFDLSVKEALEGFELPYEPADWASMEQKLDAAQAGGNSSNLTRNTAAIIGAAILAAGATFYFWPSEEAAENALANNTTLTTEHTAPNTNAVAEHMSNARVNDTEEAEAVANPAQNDDSNTDNTASPVTTEKNIAMAEGGDDVDMVGTTAPQRHRLLP